MTVKCSWCKVVMGRKDGPDQITHSICRACWMKHHPEIDPGPECEEAWKELEAQGKPDGEQTVV